MGNMSIYTKEVNNPIESEKRSKERFTYGERENGSSSSFERENAELRHNALHTSITCVLKLFKYSVECRVTQSSIFRSFSSKARLY